MISALSGRQRRVRSLDGLRGLAALVVVCWHVYLFTFSYPAIGSTLAGRTLLAASNTPARLLIAGDQAVELFFILSGLVLTLAILQGGPSRWRAYYPARLVRLYLPTAGAIMLAMTLILVVPRTTPMFTEGSWGEATNAHQVTIQNVLNHLILLFIPGRYDLDNPLWSIFWEVIFSMLLPLFILLGQVTYKQPVLMVLGCFALSWLGLLSDITPLFYLPMFQVGVITALHYSSLQEHIAKLKSSSRGQAIIALVLVLALVGTIAWQTATVAENLRASLRGFVLPAVYCYVLAACYLVRFGRFLDGTAMQFLGRISFSVYLIHVPLLVSFAYLFGADGLGATLLTFSLLLLPGAYLFYRLIEQPATKLSHRITRRVKMRQIDQVPGT